MASTNLHTSNSPRPLDRQDFRTLGLSALGGALEFYDFIIFVFFASVIGHLFFPPDMPDWLVLIQTFGIFRSRLSGAPRGRHRVGTFRRQVRPQARLRLLCLSHVHLDAGHGLPADLCDARRRCADPADRLPHVAGRCHWRRSAGCVDLRGRTRSGQSRRHGLRVPLLGPDARHHDRLADRDCHQLDFSRRKNCPPLRGAFRSSSVVFSGCLPFTCAAGWRKRRSSPK